MNKFVGILMQTSRKRLTHIRRQPLHGPHTKLNALSTIYPPRKWLRAITCAYSRYICFRARQKTRCCNFINNNILATYRKLSQLTAYTHGGEIVDFAQDYPQTIKPGNSVYSCHEAMARHCAARNSILARSIAGFVFQRQKRCARSHKTDKRSRGGDVHDDRGVVFPGSSGKAYQRHTAA